MNRRNARRHGFRVPVKPNPQQTRPKANSTGAQSRNRSTPVDLAALTRNIRYRQRARANGLATGDSADTLREKRRWVQTEFDASRINGKATPELHDLYNKRNIGKPQHQRKMAQSLSDAAKEAKRRLEEVFGQRSGLRAVAGAVGHSLGDDSGDAVHTTKRPAAHLTADNDAAARQLVLAKGYELADYSGGNQGIGAEADNTEEGEEEEGDEIEIKMEEDADEGLKS